ncbi:MAG: cellulase family glycosylhydrolase [Clostridia bacterium]|nr:cellulase family glycosylhydrolase [Clostridia bacterium]
MKKTLSVIIAIAIILCMQLNPLNTASANNNEPYLYTSGRNIMLGEDILSLHGVNITEFSWCVYGDGSNAAGQSNAHKAYKIATDVWNCNIIRLAVKPELYLYGGEYYGTVRTAEQVRALVDEFVTDATNRGIVVILDCHGYYGVTDTIIDFWKIAAAKYDKNEMVMYGLLNEPTGDWKTYYEGGNLYENNTNYTVVGMPTLLDTVRSISDNIAVIGGIDYAFDLSRITYADLAEFGGTRSAYTGLSGEQYAQKYFLCRQDRLGKGIVFDSHIYSTKPADWGRYVGNTMSQYPVLVGEYGPSYRSGVLSELTDAEKDYLIKIFDFIKQNKLYSTAWGMNAWPFLSTPDGTITPFGNEVRKFISETATKTEQNFDGNLLNNHYSSYKPLGEQIADSYIYESRTFYNQAHRNGNKVGSSIVYYLTDGDTETAYDIYAWHGYRMGLEFEMDQLLACHEISISSGQPGYPDFFKIYASDSLSTLYNEENLIENLTKAHTGTVTYTIDRQIKYIAFLAAGENGGQMRMKELALFGTLLGDISGNGKLDADDLTSIRKILLDVLSDEGITARANINSDNSIDILDFIKLKKEMA